MLTWRVLSRMLVTALYFAVCGGFGCALFLAAQAFLVALVVGSTNFMGFTRWTMTSEEAEYWAAVYVLGVVFGGVGFLFGFVTGAVIFFVAGVKIGVQPAESLPKAFKRSFHAALRASVFCGWPAAMTGAAFVALLNHRALTTENHFFGFTYGLAAGNFLGIAIGALSPGTVERVRDHIKSAFASLRRR